MTKEDLIINFLQMTAKLWNEYEQSQNKTDTSLFDEETFQRMVDVGLLSKEDFENLRKEQEVKYLKQG